MLEPGDELAGYTIERRLGAGGMGEVYIARHPRLPRSDAIKVLGRDISGDAQYRARFHREAELAAGLSHPAIAQVYDQGESDGLLWISMQLIDGTDLARRAASGPLPLPEVARMISTVADALDYAGSRGLIHRDVKPANVLVSSTGHVLLTDFGIARMATEASDLTGTGVTVGTVNYASPEQLRARDLDARSDQYSLAATAYHLLAGSGPYADTNMVNVITGHLSAPVPSIRLRRPDLAPDVDAVFTRALAKAPFERYPSSRAFAVALDTALRAPASSPTTVRSSATPYATTVKRNFPHTTSRARSWSWLNSWWVGAGALMVAVIVAAIAGAIAPDLVGTRVYDTGPVFPQLVFASAWLVPAGWLGIAGRTTPTRAVGAALMASSSIMSLCLAGYVFAFYDYGLRPLVDVPSAMIEVAFWFVAIIPAVAWSIARHSRFGWLLTVPIAATTYYFLPWLLSQQGVYVSALVKPHNIYSDWLISVLVLYVAPPLVAGVSATLVDMLLRRNLDGARNI